MIKCPQESLSKGLVMAGRVIRARTNLPITECVLIKAEENQIRLQATDLKTSLTTWIPAVVEEKGEVAIPLKILSDFVNTLPQDIVEIHLPAEEETGNCLMTVQCLNSKAHINGSPSGQFPPIPEVQQDETILVNPKEFSTAISRTEFCASNEDNRPVLTGINIKLKEQKFIMAGADGYRLAIQHGGLDAPVERTIELNLPAKFLSDINRIKGDSEGGVKIGIPANQKQAIVRFQAGAHGNFQVEMTSQMLDGTYPEYEGLIPKNNSVRAVFNHADLLQAVKSTSIFANNNFQKILLEMKQGDGEESPMATISGTSEDEGDSRTVIEIPEMTGGDLEVYFNQKFISDMLKVMDKSKIRMETNSNNSPSLFMLEESDEYLHIVMPLLQ